MVNELSVEFIQKKFFEVVRRETMKANEDVFGLDWVM